MKVAVSPITADIAATHDVNTIKSTIPFTDKTKLERKFILYHNMFKERAGKQ